MAEAAGVKKFLDAADEVASSLKSYIDGGERARIITHTDADGIASGSILAECLRTYDVVFHISFSRPLGSDEISELADQDYDLLIFLDQGSGQVHYIQEHLLNADLKVVILDHHPGDFSERTGLVHLNPNAYDLNGSRDVSASGVVYSVVKRIDEKFESLSELSIIGALGDRQGFPSGFSGINKKIVNHASDLGVIEVKEGLKLIGRNFSLVDCLSSSIKPYLLGLSGNRERCRELVEDLDFDADTTLDELGPKDEEKLRDAITERIKVTPDENFYHALWGVIYISLTKKIVEPKSLNECATILDACGKLKKPGVGFGFLLGDESSRKEVRGIFDNYQRQMIKVLEWMSSNKADFKTTPNMRYIYTEDRVGQKMIGEALSIGAESGLIELDRPVLGLADSGTDWLKVSARAPHPSRKGGPHIGNVLGEVSRKLGGHGGGHDVAAAARLPRERMDEFISEVDRAFGEQTSST
ncbi:hypothetical protein AKJ43_01440 [candidate division MSBL1 archaeon SCGC-AAA261D19]|uniref:Uncharacterized protein n=1 Tax=candidate division MSBL1 archaeon SCGC-AAA261D19 TaxID=1698273 RepID=A0A133V7Z8_9EURY|nr:hypothetical protein AKJ43_01440 [candidate division MSBL1 archaeon SCGC-AAA261D19]